MKRQIPLRPWENKTCKLKKFISKVKAQVAQARNMSVGIVAQHSKYRDLFEEKTYRFCNLGK